MNRSSKTRSPIASLLALRSVSPRLAVLPLVALSAGCFTVQSGESVASLIRTTRYQEALDLAASRAERAPKDREAQEDLNRAEAVWLVDRGRDQVFAGEHQSALASFQAAAERLPASDAVSVSKTAAMRRSFSQATSRSRCSDAARPCLATMPARVMEGEVTGSPEPGPRGAGA